MKLGRYKKYSREDVHSIFDPSGVFTPQAGTWGLHGIVNVPDSGGDYVFFVTLGSSQGAHNFDESITKNGVLTWQTQPSMDFSNSKVQGFINFDHEKNNIYLFLRKEKNTLYTYLGNLAYVEHDATRIKPVHFKWRILDWNVESATKSLGEIAVVPRAAISPKNIEKRKGVTTKDFYAKSGNDVIDEEAEKLITYDPIEFINSKIKRFEKIIIQNKDNGIHLEKLRLKFVNDFKIKKIIEMEKEEYVVGLGRQDTFCYRLETELMELGDIHGSTAVKFGLYYGIRGDDKDNKYQISEGKYGTDADQALVKIKEQIVNLIIAGGNHNYNDIRNCSLSPMFKGKILSTYYPEQYVSIFSGEHLSYFLNKLKVDFSENIDELDKQLKLVKWKNENGITKDWPMYSFARFLYQTFGSLSEAKKQVKNQQEEYDKNYPKEHVVHVGISISQWKDLIEDSEIFLEKDTELMKRIYTGENHAKTCHELGLEDGVSPSTYIKPVVALARRISSKLNLKPVIKHDGNETWWGIPFWGKYREDGHFEWKLRPELAKAIQSLYPEFDYIKDDEIADNELVEDLRKHPIADIDPVNAFKGVPKKKQDVILSNGHLTYPRDRQTARNALAHAGYECEINRNHSLFKRKNSDKNYTEPHHLVPMAYSDRFDVSLDVEENIVSLCSNCHNQLHYGEGAEELLKNLYDERKKEWEKVGIEIGLELLIEMY
ncbi:DUF3427 domain-containing protein [Desulfosporosinus sp. Sb-LF]|nr:DUF3427 domain-containing protein [Desulfosporosinus sp. Sb-LF]